MAPLAAWPNRQHTTGVARVSDYKCECECNCVCGSVYRGHIALVNGVVVGSAKYSQQETAD